MILKNRYDPWVAEGKNDISAEDLDPMFDSAFNEKPDNSNISDLVSNDKNSNTDQVTYQGKIVNFWSWSKLVNILFPSVFTHKNSVQLNVQ